MTLLPWSPRVRGKSPERVVEKREIRERGKQTIGQLSATSVRTGPTLAICGGKE